MTPTSRIRSIVIAGMGALVATPASAQSTDYRAIVGVMRECARIGEITARVACYDQAIGAEPAVAAVAGQPVSAGRPADDSFASERLRRTDAQSELPRELQSVVTAAAEREPGIFLLTLQDGSQWQFTDTAPRSYDPPRRGSPIVVSRGALGSFFLDYAKQPPLRVKRVR